MSARRRTAIVCATVLASCTTLYLAAQQRPVDTFRSDAPWREKAAIETAASLLDSLSPADAVGAIGLPVGGIDLTRDHAAVASMIRQMSGTAPAPGAGTMSWEDALKAELECSRVPDPCLRPYEEAARQMLLAGRGQAATILTSLSALMDRLGPLRAPKHLVLLSGGIPFDIGLLPRYQTLAGRAAANHVALSIVHLDQGPFDASDQLPSAIGQSGHGATVFGGREHATGLGTIASTTGGEFFMGVGRATGVFERIASHINNFYQLGVESRPSDGDGKPHRVEVKVSRAKATVFAPAETAAPRRAPDESSADALTRALAEPTDTAELPLEVASYLTHSGDSEKVRVIVAAQLAGEAGLMPTDWGYTISDGNKVVAGSQIRVSTTTAQPWSATATVDVRPGTYRLRTATVVADGRMGVLDVSLRVGLRSAGSIQTSDLIVGTAEQGQVQPRARIRQDERGVGMIEISSGEPLGDITGSMELTRGGTAQPAWRGPLSLRTRADDKSIVVAESAPNLSSLAPGTYTASVVLERAGMPVSRVSRVFEVMPGVATTAVETARRAAPAPRDPEVDGVMERVGRYVTGYGQQAFNLGPMRRNFNEPMSMLFFLLPNTQSRFDFIRKRDATVAGVKVWEIGFKEKARPTLIRTVDGLDVPSEGSIWVAPSDGTVVRTRLEVAGFAGRASTSTVEVTYARDPRLDLWLPATMKDRQDGEVAVTVESRRAMSAMRQAIVTGFATYGDFKRFETTATVKVK